MIVEYLFFETDQDMDGLMADLRDLLNLPTINRAPYFFAQDRFGVNFGGRYWWVEVLGFDLRLIRNAGETEIPGFPGHSFYLMISGGDAEATGRLADHILTVVEGAGLVAVLDRSDPAP